MTTDDFKDKVATLLNQNTESIPFEEEFPGLSLSGVLRHTERMNDPCYTLKDIQKNCIDRERVRKVIDHWQVEVPLGFDNTYPGGVAREAVLRDRARIKKVLGL